MFSKAKRFEALTPKNEAKEKKGDENQKLTNKAPPISTKLSAQPLAKNNTKNSDTHSQCSSASAKTFVTPKPVKTMSIIKAPTSLKKKQTTNNNANMNGKSKPKDGIVAAQEVEIRNKDHTIAEYTQQIEELKTEIAKLQKFVDSQSGNLGSNIDNINKQMLQISIGENKKLNYAEEFDTNKTCEDQKEPENDLMNKIYLLEHQCRNLEQELCSKQVELSSFEGIICIRDSLCKDLQEKLTEIETCLEETKQRLEMVKGHHALALEANESIRREYKAELETLKSKAEEEKQTIINKSKQEQENIKFKYHNQIEQIKMENETEKQDIIKGLQQQIMLKDNEMKAKLEQVNESTHEKLRLCEIQFEERCRSIQEHWSQQQEKLQYLDKETSELKFSLNLSDEKNLKLQGELNHLRLNNELLQSEKSNLAREVEDLKDDTKKKYIDFENEVNKLTVEIDKIRKDKMKFEMSLSVTRDIVHVLTMRLRESDNELEHLESKIQTLTDANQSLEGELGSYKNSLSNTLIECNEYKEALVNILKSKAALAKEHTRIMEHNVTLIESLQNVEKEAYRELGTIKNDLIEDVEFLKNESRTQIQLLREEVEKKRVLCELATDHAGQATAAAEQSRAVLAQAAMEITRLEGDNQRLQQQIEDQQSLVVELSLLRQENEDLAMMVAKQTSVIDKLKKDIEQVNTKPKSPSVHKKSYKIGKENAQIVVSPLRERNH